MVTVTYTGIEHQELEIPISQVVNASGDFELYPEVQARKYFEIRFRRNQLVLTAGSFIGQIPINDRVIIDVKPKVPFGNLVAIVGSSGHQLQLLDFYRRTYAEHGKLPENIFSFLCNCLSVELRWITREGQFREYLRIDQTTSFPKGKPLFERSLTNHWCKGNYHRVEVSVFQFTTDTAYNRLIKYTLWYCLRHLVRLGSYDELLLRELSAYYKMFELVSLDRSRRFEDVAREALIAKKIPHIRSYYEGIMRTCLSVIANVGIDLVKKGGEYEASSFVVNLANVFESYIFNMCKKAMDNYDTSITVLDGNGDGMKPLFEDTLSYDAKPDVILSRGSKSLLILDAKYKKKTNESDRYQLISHAVSYGVSTAIHVVPGSKTSKGIEYVGTVGTEAPIAIYKYKFDLESEPLDEAEGEFFLEISKILMVVDSEQ